MNKCSDCKITYIEELVNSRNPTCVNCQIKFQKELGNIFINVSENDVKTVNRDVELIKNCIGINEELLGTI